MWRMFTWTLCLRSVIITRSLVLSSAAKTASCWDNMDRTAMSSFSSCCSSLIHTFLLHVSTIICKTGAVNRLYRPCLNFIHGPASRCCLSLSVVQRANDAVSNCSNTALGASQARGVFAWLPRVFLGRTKVRTSRLYLPVLDLENAK